RQQAYDQLVAAQNHSKNHDPEKMLSSITAAMNLAKKANDPQLDAEIRRLMETPAGRLATASGIYRQMGHKANWSVFDNIIFDSPWVNLFAHIGGAITANGLNRACDFVGDPDLSKYGREVGSAFDAYMTWNQTNRNLDNQGDNSDIG